MFSSVVSSARPANSGASVALTVSKAGRIDISSCRTPRRRAISCASCTLMPAV
jgi:hypothetical protein